MFEAKKERLLHKIESFAEKDVCVAFSGGVDSSLLLKLAVDAARKKGTTVYAVTFETSLHPKADLGIAKQVAAQIGASHVVLEVNEFDDPGILQNPVNRCYLCKKMLFTKLIDFAGKQGTDCVMEGTNADDLLVYRPGLQAVRELQVQSPLADTAFTKEEVRRLAAEYEITVSGRPSAPCLATRIPYGTVLNPEVLERIDRGEMYLKTLGFAQVRIRQHGDITRIEVPASQFEEVVTQAESICSSLEKLGFRYLTLDLKGFRSGSMDEYLN
ncbi:MAG: ATP-dependent sacrificial sulfur transferase LarE [Lachnospiraceae bacterium]|nr:ATP-dependent sacrificial sulfur transferase LarE [Lachnospiraceae bacterium]